MHLLLLLLLLLILLLLRLLLLLLLLPLILLLLLLILPCRSRSSGCAVAVLSRGMSGAGRQSRGPSPPAVVGEENGDGDDYSPGGDRAACVNPILDLL